MTDRDEESDSRELIPPEMDYTHLPDQTMYKIELDEAGHFTQSDDIQTYPVCITNEFKLLYFEMEPGGVVDWHTHTPAFDEVSMCLSGRARYTLEQEEGSHQTLTIGPREFVYLPGGALFRLELKDEATEFLSALCPKSAASPEVTTASS